MAFTVVLILTSFLSILALSKSIEFVNLDECGKSRACWASPPGCVNNGGNKCQVIVRWKFHVNKLDLEIQAKSLTKESVGQWMALGFSDDRSMGNDTIFECQFGSGKTGHSEAYVSYNENTNNIQLPDASNKLLKNKLFHADTDQMLCVFQVDFDEMKDVVERNTKIFKLDGGDWWHLLFAQGILNQKTGLKTIHSLVLRSEQLVKICETCSDQHVVIEKK